MELKYKRKMRMPIGSLPGFANGYDPRQLAVNRQDPLGIGYRIPDLSQFHGLKNEQLPKSVIQNNKLDFGGMLTPAVSFVGDSINAFGPVKNENELMSDSGTTYSEGTGFGYTQQNNINASQQMRELSQQNTNNTLKLAASGAALGSVIPGVGNLVGGAAGAVVGAITGIFGGAHRRRKLRRRIFEAQQNANRYNNFAQSSAQSDYLDQLYDANHENTQDDLLYANSGKDQNTMLKNININKKSYTSLGKYNVKPNAKVSAAESIIDNIDDVNNTTGHVVKNGKLNQDTNYANVNDNTVILGNTVDWRTGVNFRDQALPYTSALEKINNKYEKRTNSSINKLRGRIGKESDNVQQQEINKLKQPVVQKLKDLADQQKYQHDIMNMQTYNNYASGKNQTGIPGMNWLSNAVPMGLGMVTSLGQYLQANKQDINTPDIYAGNPYENTALAQLARIRQNPYPILRDVYDADRRNRYAINRAGGLSGAQKYLANVASGLATNSNIADTLFKSQEQNNQYMSQYANALLQAGAQNAQRRQSANQYNTEYASAAHAAKQQGMQMGLRNFMDYIQQYAANEYKRQTGNGMLGLYQQKVDLDREALRNSFPTKTTSTRSTKTTPKVKVNTNPVQTEWKYAMPTGYLDNNGFYHTPWESYYKQK